MELSKPSDFKGFIYALGHLALWFGAGALSYYNFISRDWLWFFVFIFIQGTIGCFFNAAHHELHHETVFKTRKLNKIFLDVYGLLGWLDPITYSLSHTHHHRNTLHNGVDYEEVHPKIPSLHILYLIQLFSINITGGEKSAGIVPTVNKFAKIAFKDLSNPFQDWDFRLYSELPDEAAQAVNWARTVLIFHLAVTVFAFSINQPVLALIISGSRFIGGWLFYFASSPQHCGLQTDTSDYRKCVRSITLDSFTEYYILEYELAPRTPYVYFSTMLQSKKITSIDF